MSYHLLKLRRAKKKFNGFGMEKADLKQVIALLTETFATDHVNGLDKLNTFNELLAAAKGLVESRCELLSERDHEDLDSEDLEIIHQNEQELNQELSMFCEIFNGICATAGVVEYFASDNGDSIWNEVTTYFTA